MVCYLRLLLTDLLIYLSDILRLMLRRHLITLLGLQAVSPSGPTKTSVSVTIPDFSDAEIPSGVCNGQNTVFRLGNTPLSTCRPLVALNGVTQCPGLDFTVSGNTLTFAVPPDPGGVLVVWYRY